MIDQDLKRAIIVDHYSKPHNHGLVEDSRYKQRHMASDSCVDDITVQLLLDGETIKDVRFDGYACAISTASTSILCDMVKGKSKKEALDLLNEYKSMLENGPYDEDRMAELNAFDSLYKQPNRLNCGSIGLRALLQMLEEE